MARKSKSPVDMSTLFQKTSGTLAQISQKTNSIQKIADIVRQICPDLPEESWHIANFSQQKVVIEVGSSIWAQRFQFEKNRIAQQLAISTENTFNTIEIKVNPHFSKSKVKPKTEQQTKKSMSQTSANQLETVAQKAPKSLQEKIQRLAQHVNKSNT